MVLALARLRQESRTYLCLLFLSWKTSFVKSHASLRAHRICSRVSSCVPSSKFGLHGLLSWGSNNWMISFDGHFFSRILRDTSCPWWTRRCDSIPTFLSISTSASDSLFWALPSPWRARAASLKIFEKILPLKQEVLLVHVQMMTHFRTHDPFLVSTVINYPLKMTRHLASFSRSFQNWTFGRDLPRFRKLAAVVCCILLPAENRDTEGVRTHFSLLR